MKKTLVSASGIVFLFAGMYVITAQNRDPTMVDLIRTMAESEKITKTTPYRSVVTVETGEQPVGPWKPYSSWVAEAIFPDRHYLKYTSRGNGEYVTIGKDRYAKENDGEWIKSQAEAIRSVMNLATPRGFSSPPLSDFFRLSSRETGEQYSAIFKVVSRKKVGADAKETVQTTYWFDEKGIFVMQESVAYNGFNFVHRTERYEYDADIKIEVPIK